MKFSLITVYLVMITFVQVGAAVQIEQGNITREVIEYSHYSERSCGAVKNSVAMNRVSESLSISIVVHRDEYIDCPESQSLSYSGLTISKNMLRDLPRLLNDFRKLENVEINITSQKLLNAPIIYSINSSSSWPDDYMVYLKSNFSSDEARDLQYRKMIHAVILENDNFARVISLFQEHDCSLIIRDTPFDPTNFRKGYMNANELSKHGDFASGRLKVNKSKYPFFKSGVLFDVQCQ